MSYTEVIFITDYPEIVHQILIAQLGELDYESFVEEDDSLKAYIDHQKFDVQLLNDLQIIQNQEFKIDYSYQNIKQQNWNKTWEDNFQPVVISEDCVIRAPFHKSFDKIYELIIEPKMSFGTGHHATTHMMLLELLKQDCKGKSVLDMGCGTGVLSILAEKKGALDILAIDIDEWCFENTSENIERNQCHNITPKQGSAEQIEGEFEIILANINRNILLEQIPIYAEHLKAKGFLLLSGFYSEDISQLNAMAEENALHFVKHHIKNKWVCAKYFKE